MSDMEHYRDQLKHVVRPEDPRERREADSVILYDFEALYLYTGLTEYAAYHAKTEEEEQIALAYAEYINMVVRDEGERTVPMFAHTEKAKDVLAKSALAVPAAERDIQGTIVDKADMVL